MAPTFNPSTWEVEAGGSLSLSSVWSTDRVPGQPGLCRETLSQKNKRTEQNKKTPNKNKTKEMRDVKVAVLNYMRDCLRARGCLLTTEVGTRLGESRKQIWASKNDNSVIKFAQLQPAPVAQRRHTFKDRMCFSLWYLNFYFPTMTRKTTEVA